MSRSTILIVGAGFAGSVCARILAERGHQVHVIDRRAHVGGNAYDEYDAHGVLIHRYGPHIFHTQARRIFDFLSRFTKWRPYEHRVLSFVAGRMLPFPINRITLNELYGLNLATEEDVQAYLESVREPRDNVTNSEELVLNAVGRDLFEKFFKNYTRKQWGMEASELKAGVAARIPVRTNDDDRYFSDTYQAIPADGYTTVFLNMLDHSGIRTCLSTDFFDFRAEFKVDHTVFTGPLDAFYGYRFGRLPYRSLRFEHEHIQGVAEFQPVATVNFPNDHQYTRITEFKHLTGQSHPGTSIVREYPQDDGDPYYPIPSVENEALYQRYAALARAEPNVTFVGRLAQYRYYNMDQVVGAAMKAAEEILQRLP